MKRYLAVFLCLFFLLGSPADAAIANDKTKPGQTGLSAPTKATNLNSGKTGYTTGDLNLLARLVHAEAKGEPYRGKVAVAATVLNRVNDPHYPDTIPGVIYEYNYGFQYCPVGNGEINYPADRQAYQAVEEALEGKDPTHGALSFYNPSKSNNGWISSKLCLTTIGNHVFVK